MCFFLLIGLILIFSCQQAEETLVEKPMDIHDRVLTVDTHVDTPYMLLQPGFDITKVNDRNQGGGQVDFPRMKQGGLDVMLQALAENGGVIQLCLLSSYIKKVDQDPNREEAMKKLEEKYPDRRQSEDEQKKYETERGEIDRMYPRRRATVADAVTQKNRSGKSGEAI